MLHVIPMRMILKQKEYSKYWCSCIHDAELVSTQGRIKGRHFGQVPGAPRFRGAQCADFLGLVVVYIPMFFGTALHNFGRTYHICSGVLGHHVLISNMNRGPFCVISCERWLRMRKIMFQRFQISKFSKLFLNLLILFFLVILCISNLVIL